MSEELLINISPVENRVAVMTDGVVSEVYIERASKLGLVGNIYLGTVVRVLPGMQAAFIDIGQSRTAFLHVNDMRRLPDPNKEASNISAVDKPSSQSEDDGIVEADLPKSELTPNETGDSDTTVNVSQSIDTDKSLLDNAAHLVPPTRPREPSPPTLLTSIDVERQDVYLGKASSNPSNPTTSALSSSVSRRDTNRREPAAYKLIQNRLQQGQRVLVQVTKDELGTKGARLTTNISLPSRYLVYLPSSEHVGISQRIDDDTERHRLKTELTDLMQTVGLSGGLIARTAAERVPMAKLEEDIYYLVQLWRTVNARKQEALTKNESATLIYQDLTLPLRAIRDLVNADTERVVVDNGDMGERLTQFAKEFVPSIAPRIVLHTSEQPLFDLHRVEEDLKDALKRRVNLKSGGYLIIDQTEAMTTIDVNTGSFVGGRSLEDTVYKTNLEATQAIARQLRLRNLGGIIILDFIDMMEEGHKQDVLSNLQRQLAQDYAKTKITQVSELGLIEMTRKRTRESLEQLLCEPCPTCEGRGFVKSAETVCFEIFREIMRCARTYNAPKQFTVVASASVIDLLLSSEANTVADLEYLVGRVITFEVESLYTQEQYDIVLD